MKQKTIGDEDDEDLLFILGWGNRLRSKNVQWLIDLVVEDGYQVHAFELPDHTEDFEADFIEPVHSYIKQFDSFKLLCHSTGGLVGAYLTGAETETYLSPWWGIYAGQDGPLFDLLTKLPLTASVVPNNTATRPRIGELATSDQLDAIPKRTSPVFLREVSQAQKDRPPIDDEAVVFCSLCDDIVSTRAIGEAVPPEQIVLYQGGHELFSSPGREKYTDRLLAAIEEGVDGI